MNKESQDVWARTHDRVWLVDKVELTLEVRSPKTTEVLGKMSQSVPADSLFGNVALANGFPSAPVSQNGEKMKPDLVFFSGDQIYESHGGSSPDAADATPVLQHISVCYGDTVY
ncbi:MAG: hypothetical protein QNL33_11445 [Akkermansiaceae bacterium]